ncbi:MAG: shikimate dehydrogenase [Pseudomonadota bacterium]
MTVPRYLMIGAPVTGVRTPPLLEAALAKAGRPATVGAVHVEPADLAAVMKNVRADRDILGLMVTMPHKNAIAPHLDRLTDEARASGSINAVKRMGAELVGAQFDGIALNNALRSVGADLEGATVRLAGGGGAGLAIAFTLDASGARLTLVEPDASRRARALSALPGLPLLARDDGREADILVNATPLGMTEGDPSPFTEAQVRSARLIADIVADPHHTALGTLAAAANRPFVTGRTMVEHQIGPITAWLLSDGEAQLT